MFQLIIRNSVVSLLKLNAGPSIPHKTLDATLPPPQRGEVFLDFDLTSGGGFSAFDLEVFQDSDERGKFVRIFPIFPF